MNKHLHRVIFNAARGIRMAVQEAATSAGKASRASTQTAAASAVAAALLLLLGIHQPSYAQIIADPAAPGQQRPTVLPSANGTPTINIQTPSASGVSRNSYRQFDIDSKGAILNNSRTNTTTQVGGWIQGNPWLAGGSAKVIVNEVNSAAASRLMGPLEVAGQRADVIIASPGGLIVDGLSFINAAGVTLSTGRPQYGPGGAVSGLPVQEGQIHIQGQGMDATQADYARILARAVTLNAGLWAQEAHIATGTQQPAASPAPQFALDVAHLGGMYAGKIHIIGTEAGLGVRNAGTIAATAGPLVLDVNGQLHNGGAIGSSAGDTTVRVSDTLTNEGVLDGQHTLVEASTINNQGTGRIYGGHLSIRADTVNNSAHNGVAATIAARQRLDIAATTINNQDGATILSLGDIHIGATLDTQGQASGQAQSLHNTGAKIQAAGNIAVNAKAVYNANAGLEIAQQEFVRTEAGENMVQLPGSQPESASLYAEVWDGTFIPYIDGRSAFQSQDSNGVPGGYSDGRIYKPAHPDRFLKTKPLAYQVIENCTGSGGEGGGQTCTYAYRYEPAGSPRFAQYGIAVPQNYRTTAPTPLEFGARYFGLGNTIHWPDSSSQAAYNAAVVDYQNSIAAAIALNRLILAEIKEDNRILTSSREYTLINNVTKSLYRDRIASTAPAEIIAGGNITASGLLSNLDSSVIAHGDISAETLDSRSTVVGIETWRYAGTGTFYYWRHKGGFSDSQKRHSNGAQAFSYAQSTTFELPTTTFAPQHPGAGTVEATLPSSSLYILQADNPIKPLIETDPAFTQYKQWLSSDYMLDVLKLDPALMQKRLGDGFYEQQLVQQQIGQLTGQRFLGNYSSDEAQYQALLQSGVTFAQAYKLRPGIALSAAQMAQLTSDIVWLVAQNVTLPDGSVQSVLVPQVYVVPRPGDLNAHGTLLSGDSIRIQSDSTAHNSGTIAGRRAVQIAALDIDNIGGRIVADTVNLQAQRDINVIGGSVSAALALLAQAGNDINVQSTTGSSSGGTGANGYANTVIDQVAALNVTGTSGATESATLALQAGRDITLQAAQITNTATNAATQISAGHNLNLQTVNTSKEQRITWDSKNHLFFGSSQEVGTQIDTQGSTLLAAGNDITARAAQVQSTAEVQLQAGGDIHIATGQASQWLDDAYYIQSSGLLGSGSETWINKVHTTEAQASSIGAETIQISAGRNLEVTGSNAVSDKGTALQAGQDIAIAAASNTHSALHFNEERRSGLFSSGIGFTVGSQMQSTDQRSQQTSAAAATVGSIEGNVSIQAGQDYRQIGSDILAPAGDIAIAAKDIAITEAEQTHNSQQHTRFKQSGISVSIGSPIISMAQTAQGMAQAASNTSDTRMQALAAGAAALNVSNNQDALQALASGNPAAGASISISVGSSQSRSDSYQSASTSQGSHVQASGDVQITATGAGQNSNLTIQGSDITAGNNANLTADNDITLLASTDTHSERSSNKSSSGAIGIAIGQGGIGITASASRGKGYANSDDTAYNNTHITAGNTASLQSGNDTQLKGAVVSAEQVTANVGGNLNIQSLQDSSTFDGKQQNIGGSITVGAGFSASVSYSNSKASGNYASVTEQSGIQAGDNGFQIHVQGNTDLQGATIASTQEAIDNDRNSLRTGTLTSSDIANRSNYKASGINLSGGFTVAGNNPADQSTGTSSTVDNGENWSWQNFNKTGTSGAAAGVSSDKGNTQSTTTSSISAGQFTMTDAEGQQQKTGQSAAQMVASIDRTAITGDSASGLEKTWNGQQLLQAQTANAQIIATFGQQASKAIGDYAAEQMKTIGALRAQGKNAEADAIEALWGDNGSLRLAAHTAVGALTGGTSGAAGAAAGTLAAPQVAEALQAAGITGPLADILTATASTAAGAAVGGASGAAAAGNEVANNYLKHQERLLLNQSLQACYANGDASACGTAAALKEKDQLSDKLLANAVATCNGTECDDVSKFIQHQMAELGCTIPSACQDQGTLHDYWRVVQSKAQGLEAVYPESWVLDAKLVLDLSKYGLRILTTTVGADVGAKASLEALGQLSKAEVRPITSGGTANIATGEKLIDDLVSKIVKPHVSDTRLSGLMDDLYRDGAKIGSGSTADAVRYEAATGNSVGGKLHTQKAENYSAALQKWLDLNPNASFNDRSAAKQVLRDLQNALRGK